MLTRTLAYLTLSLYLVVGTVAVRLYFPSVKTFSISTSYLTSFTDFALKTENALEMETPEMAFSPIEFPVEKAPVLVKSVARTAMPRKEVTRKERVLPETKILAKNELNFTQPIQLSPVEFSFTHLENLMALYSELPITAEVMLAKTNNVEQVQDVVNTTLAASDSIDAEPIFFEYPVEDIVVKEEAVVVATQEATEPVKEVPEEKVADIPVSEEIAVEDLIAYDYTPAVVDKSPSIPQIGIAANQAQTVTIQQQKKNGYSKPKAPKVAQVNTHSLSSQNQKKEALMSSQDSAKKPQEETAQSFLPSSFASQLTIQVVGTDLKKNLPLNQFQVRFADDHAEIIDDVNGKVVLNEQMANTAMTRTVKVIKPGFATTSHEAILLNAASEVSIPVMEEKMLNGLLSEFAHKGPVGALLLELADDTEYAQVDVPFGKVLTLDGNMKVTERDDYRYQLFVGIQAGNAVVSYKNINGEKVSKIVHIHDHELTYDANFYEDITSKTFRLHEEDLLSQELSPLIISSDNVKQFITNKTAKKINDRTYRIDFSKGIEASRRYIELGHQAEPIFVGFRDQKDIQVPSENFMRFITSSMPHNDKANRCIVQVNLSKVAVDYKVSAESVEHSVEAYAQVLDSDGKFYDSVGEKSRKIIILGDIRANDEASSNAKMNIKITYQDGEVQYLSSYCSPNTYLIEQL